MNKQEALLRQTIREMASSTEVEQQSHEEALLREAVRAMLLNEIGPDVDYGKPLLSLFEPVADVLKIAKSEIGQLKTASGASITATLKGFQNLFKGENFFDAEVASILKQGQNEIRRIEQEYASAYQNVDANFLDAVGQTFLVDPGLALSALATDQASLRKVWDLLGLPKKKKDTDERDPDEFSLIVYKMSPKAIKKIHRAMKGSKIDIVQSKDKKKLYAFPTSRTKRNSIENFISSEGLYRAWLVDSRTDGRVENLPDKVVENARKLGFLTVFIADGALPEYRGDLPDDPKDVEPNTRKSMSKNKALGFQTGPLPDTAVSGDWTTGTGGKDPDKTDNVGDSSLGAAGAKGDPSEPKQDLESALGAIGSRLFSDDDKIAEIAAGEARVLFKKNKGAVKRRFQTEDVAESIVEVAKKVANALVKQAARALRVKSFAQAKAFVASLKADPENLADLIEMIEKDIKAIKGKYGTTINPEQKAEIAELEKMFWDMWDDGVKTQYINAISNQMKRERIVDGSELDKIYTAAVQKIAAM